MKVNKIKPINALEKSLIVLKYTGYFKAVPEIEHPIKAVLHDAYRIFTLLVLLVYNVQHCVFIVKVFGDFEIVMDVLSIFITAMYCIIKFICMNLNSCRFEYLHEILDDDIFSATCSDDEEIINNNKKHFDRLSKTIYIAIAIISVGWLTTPILKKISGEKVVVAAYFPFNTETWVGFNIANFWVILILMWIGYGQMTIDLLFIGYYCQIIVQLKLIKYQLEHLADSEDDRGTKICNEQNTTYIDHNNDKYRRKLIKIINRYEKVIWFYNEVTSLMSLPILAQCFGSTGIVCIVVYRMSETTFNMITFVYLALYLACLLVELYMYCYYGTSLEVESTQINDSVYLSEWTSLSPRFRKQLLIAMTRWSRPLTPLAAGLIPVSLNTFIVVLRLSYTIYTILCST